MQKHISNLNPQSAGWLTAALDPYHDYQYDVDGLPDEKTAPCVVQIHNQSITLSAPTSAAGGNWDCSIAYTGFNSLIDHPGSAANAGLVRSGGVDCPYNHAFLPTGTCPFGSIFTWSGAVGTTMRLGDPVNAGDAYHELGSVLSQDRCRLIGVALEVHNTTAEIYRQGSLTVAQLSDVSTDTNLGRYLDQNAAPYPPYAVQCDRSTILSSTLAPLLAVPGSQTWPAADGVYAVPRMTTVPRNTTYFTDMSGRVPIVYGSNGDIAMPEPWAFSPTGFVSVKTAIPSGFSPIQVFLSGLSPQTTLTLTYRTVVEYFPAVGSPLLPLAEPSPAYDPEVFRIYSLAVAEAPYAVPVGQNAAGDYFRKVMRVLSKTLDYASPALGSYAPVATLAARVAGRLGREKAKVDKESAGAAARQTGKRKP